MEIKASETIKEQRANEDSAALEEESGEDPDYNYEEEDKDEDGEDDAEIDDEFETWKSYYQRGQGKTFISQLLILFFRHLQTINGGGMKERLAINQAQNVRKIKQCLDDHAGEGTNNDLSCFLKDGGLDICKEWAQPKVNNKELHPGTVKAYLTSLAKFFDFILDQHDVSGMPHISAKTLDQLPKILKRVKTWGSSISRLYGHERWEQILEDSRNSITTDDIKNVLTFEPSTYAELCLKKSETEALIQSEFIAVRDYLIVRLGLENAQRPGPMEAARLRDFETAEEDGEGNYVMYVARHKTSRPGPAPLVMNRSLYKHVRRYVRVVRPAFAKKDEVALFVTQEGGTAP